MIGWCSFIHRGRWTRTIAQDCSGATTIDLDHLGVFAKDDCARLRCIWKVPGRFCPLYISHSGAGVEPNFVLSWNSRLQHSSRRECGALNVKAELAVANWSTPERPFGRMQNVLAGFWDPCAGSEKRRNKFIFPDYRIASMDSPWERPDSRLTRELAKWSPRRTDREPSSAPQSVQKTAHMKLLVP